MRRYYPAAEVADIRGTADHNRDNTGCTAGDVRSRSSELITEILGIQAEPVHSFSLPPDHIK